MTNGPGRGRILKSKASRNSCIRDRATTGNMQNSQFAMPDDVGPRTTTAWNDDSPGAVVGPTVCQLDSQTASQAASSLCPDIHSFRRSTIFMTELRFIASRQRRTNSSFKYGTRCHVVAALRMSNVFCFFLLSTSYFLPACFLEAALARHSKLVDIFVTFSLFVFGFLCVVLGIPYRFWFLCIANRSLKLPRNQLIRASDLYASSHSSTSL